MKAVTVKNFSYGYEKDKILDDITLDIEEGEFISVIGPNGAGKSTLIKCLCRITSNISVGIEIYGCKLETYKQVDLSKIIGYVPQSDGRLLPFTAKDFILMSRYPHKKSFESLDAFDYEAAKFAMEITNTTRFADRDLDKMSGGERQKILIAAAIAQDPKILLLDEPTTFLDPKHQAEVMNIARNINKTHKITIITVTHDLNAAIAVSDRIVALKDGQIAFNGGVDDFIDNHYAEDIFDTNFIYTHSEKNNTYIFPRI